LPAMSALRILHVVPYYEQAWAYGGIPRLATAMTRGLAHRGHHVTVCTTDVRDSESRASPDPAGAHGVDVRMFPNVSNRLAYHFQIFAPIGLRSFLRASARDFDIAHIHACHNLPGVIAAHALSRACVPYVVQPNGTAEPIERRIAAKRVFAYTAGRRFLHDAARVIAVSEAERAQLRRLHVGETSIALVPNPLDEREFDTVPDRAQFRSLLDIGDERLVLFLGKMTPRKGVHHLVRAFASATRPGAVLAIAGNDMGSGAAVIALVRKLGLERRVFVTGLLTGAARLAALASADVVVYPSRDEIFGLVPLEALLCGTPVVVCGDSGCGEIISRTGGGHVVPYGDVPALSGAIESILGDPDAWRGRAHAAAESVRRLYGSDAVCAQLEALYVDVLDPRRSTRRMIA
jgi:glycosyltransferase involved in cell wall biosynthesis